jgi:PAS domain S-box-containing protein/diguanylate cyclase (GGDEF)-like protein
LDIKLHSGFNKPSPKKDAQSKQAHRSSVDEQYRNMIQNLPQVVFEIDMNSCWSFLNTSWALFSGFEVDECIGSNYLDYVHPQDRTRCKGVFDNMRSGEVEHCTEAFRFLVSDGNYLWIEIHAATAHSPENEPSGIVGTINNISDRVSEEELLLANQRTLTATLNDLPGMVYRCRNNPDYTMEYVSGSSHQLTGYHAQDIINNKRLSYGSMIHPDDKLGVWEGVQKGIRENRRYELVYRIITADGKERTVWECGKGIFAHNNEWLGLEGLIIDFTRQKANAHNQLERQLYDEVTGLPSLPLFLDRLQTTIQCAGDREFDATLFVVHLDRVLNVLDPVDNDAFNKASIGVGKRLASITGPRDSITRLENERWGILIDNQDEKLSITGVAQQIQDLFLEPVMIGSSKIYVTTSIGVVPCNDTFQNAEEWLRNAGHAMDRAHALGGGRYEIFDPQIHKQYITGI